MAEAATAVAQDVLQEVRKGKIPNKGKIIRKHGYSLSVSKAPTKVTKTKAYKAVVEPVAIRWEKERERITQKMEQTELDVVQYRDLAKVLDTLTQNIQLLTGGATANVATKVLVEFIDAKDNKDTNGV